MADKTPQLPPTPVSAEPRAQRWYEAVAAQMKSALSSLSSLANSMTQVQQTVGGIKESVATINAQVFNAEIPPALTGLVADGALANIILHWDAPTFANFGFAEVYRSATDNFGDAFLIGTTRSAIYVDNTGAAAAYYYWIRGVSTYGVRGPVNGSAGTLGKTSRDPSYVMEILLQQRWQALTVYEPFQYVRPSVDNGFQYLCIQGGTSSAIEPSWPVISGLSLGGTVSDGTVVWEVLHKTDKVPFTIGMVGGEEVVAIDTAFIQDASITAAKIENAFIDNLVAAQGTIGHANISQGDIFDLTVLDTIKSSNYVPGTTGWIIKKNGFLEMNDGVFRGTLTANTLITPFIKGGRIVLADDFYYLSDADVGTYTLICISRATSDVSSSGSIGISDPTLVTAPAFNILAYDNSDVTDPTSFQRQRWLNTPTGLAISTYGCTPPTMTISYTTLSTIVAFNTLEVLAGTTPIFSATFTFPTFGSLPATLTTSAANSLPAGGTAYLSINIVAAGGFSANFTLTAWIDDMEYSGNDFLSFRISGPFIGGRVSAIGWSLTGSYSCLNSLAHNNGT